MTTLSANLGFLWPELPLLARIDAAAKVGFPAIELHWPYDVPATDVRAACTRHGLALLGLNTPIGDAAKGEFGLGALPGREADFAAAMQQSIDYAVAAGAGAIHVMPGVTAGMDKALARETFIGNLKRFAPQAAEKGLTLLLEAINPRDKPGYFYSTQGEAAEIIASVGAPNIKLMFDVYHCGVAEGDITRKLEHFLPLIGHIQIAAVPSRNEPDEGEVDYRHIFAQLTRLGWDKPIGCEYRPRASTYAGLGWRGKLGLA
ncbi:MAG: hydroxypyruvate isomerase family protein [Bosea sp. (in: a-proteobacteria)]